MRTTGKRISIIIIALMVAGSMIPELTMPLMAFGMTENNPDGNVSESETFSNNPEVGDELDSLGSSVLPKNTTLPENTSIAEGPEQQSLPQNQEGSEIPSVNANNEGAFLVGTPAEEVRTQNEEGVEPHSKTGGSTAEEERTPALTKGKNNAVKSPGRVTLKSVKRSGMKATLKWGSVKNVTGYQVYRKTVGRGGYKHMGNYSAKTFSATDRGLKKGGTYRYAVRAYKTYKVKQWYNKKTCKWQTSKPGKKNCGRSRMAKAHKFGRFSVIKEVSVPLSAPTGVKTSWCKYLKSNGKSYWGIDVRWNKVSGAAKYRVYVDGKLEKRTIASEEKCNYFFAIEADQNKAHKVQVAAVSTAGKVSPKRTVTAKARKKPTARYSYDVKFFHQPYSGYGTGFFVQTKNPSDLNFDVIFCNAKGKEVSASDVSGQEYMDLPLPAKYKKDNSVPDIWPVKGGFVDDVIIDKPGEVTVKVREFPKGKTEDDYFYGRCSCVTKTVGKITVLDSDKSQKEWMSKVISKATNSSMSKKEKMQAIADYLQNTTKYEKNYIDKNGEMLYLTRIQDEGIPEWVSGEWDSYSSPAMLVEFGAMIGYPMHNMYGDYPIGSEGWIMYHFFAKSKSDGTMYKFSNPATTNQFKNIHCRDDVKKIDCLSYSKYYKCRK